jgi:hypothetical protein
MVLLIHSKTNTLETEVSMKTLKFALIAASMAFSIVSLVIFPGCLQLCLPSLSIMGSWIIRYLLLLVI